VGSVFIDASHQIGCILKFRPSGNARTAIPCVKAIGSRPCVALVCSLPRIWDASHQICLLAARRFRGIIGLTNQTKILSIRRWPNLTGAYRGIA
jgi:hypothetical protein